MPERRTWAGYFLICAECSTRNWIGRAACTACGASLAAVPPRGGEPPGRGRRGGDRFWARRLAWTLIAGALLATGTALVVRQVLRADPRGFVSIPAPPPDAVPLAPREPVEAAEAPLPVAAAPSTLEDRAAFDRGRRLLEAGQERASLGPLTQAAAAFPDDAMVTYTYGNALWRTGSRDRALFQFEKAVRLAPDAASYHVTLALALARAGRRERAMQEYQTAYQLDPTSAAAAEGLAGFGASPVAATSAGFRDASDGAPGAGGSVDLGGSSRPPASAQPAAQPSSPGRRVFTDEDLRAYRAGVPPPPSSLPRPAQ